MTNKLYSELAEVGHEFYKIYFPHNKIADIIENYLIKYNCKKIVFFGAFIHVAKILKSRGYDITFVDYTDEMLEEAKKVLGNIIYIKSDMRNLKLDQKYDAIVLMGRILTYMYSDEDVLKAFNSFKNNLKKNGILIMDNYETGKIDTGNYFTGIVKGKGKDKTIKRISKIDRIKESPTLYTWNSKYEIISENKTKVYTDENHLLRSFRKDEVEKVINKSDLKFIEHSNNFEEISFVTIAQN